MDLGALGSFYGTDKTIHGYLPHYETRFHSMQTASITLLEIGILKGASLRMWRDYFIHGQICGIDINPQSMFKESRIHTYCGDQQDTEFLNSVISKIKPLDIVIDDACHKADYQVALFRNLWPFVTVGGWYCIEDCYSISLPRLAPRDVPTIIDEIHNQRMEILTGQSDIGEINIIGHGPCDGLVMFRKREPWRD